MSTDGDLSADEIRRRVQAMGPQEQLHVLTPLAQQLPRQQRAELLNALAGGAGSPDQGTSDFIWKSVIVTFCLIAVGGAGTLAAIALGVQDFKSSPNAQVMLTVFTSVVTFLAGLFSPSPTGGSTTGNAQNP